MISTRSFIMQEDYDDYARWSRGHGFPVIDPYWLSSNGAVAERDRVKLCAAFLFMTDSNWAMIQFPVTNPGASLRSKKEGLRLVIEALVKKATELNYKSVFTYVDRPSLIRLYKENDFTKCDEDVTHLVRRINQCPL